MSNTTIWARVPEAMAAVIREIAERERRTLGTQAGIFVEEGLKAMGIKWQDDAPPRPERVRRPTAEAR